MNWQKRILTRSIFFMLFNFAAMQIQANKTEPNPEQKEESTFKSSKEDFAYTGRPIRRWVRDLPVTGLLAGVVGVISRLSKGNLVVATIYMFTLSTVGLASSRYYLRSRLQKQNEREWKQQKQKQYDSEHHDPN